MITLLALLGGCGPEGIDGWFVRLHGAVVDEEGAPLEGAEVTLASGEGALVGVASTDAEGAWSLPVHGTALEGNVVVALVRADGFAEGRATYEVNLVSPETRTLRAGPGQDWETTERRLAAIRLGAEADSASVAGRVLDATTGEPADGVSLVLQQGWNASIGDPAVADTVTADGGGFRFEAAAAGVYTVSTSGSGDWGPARFPVLLTGAGTLGAVGVVAPPIEAGQLRASLVWGDTPLDLDLHLSGPLAGGQAGVDGTGQYHVWEDDPTHPDRVTDEEAYVAWVERADADGDGPETVYVDALSEHGEVRLSVFDNDNRSDDANVALAGSGATLQVWFGEDYPRYYTIAPNQAATLWRPVEIDVATAMVYAVEQYEVGVDPADPTAF